jgi:serine/threonine-protein kinase
MICQIQRDPQVARDGCWGEDNHIVAAVNSSFRGFPPQAGTPVPSTELTQGEIIHRWPQVLPGNKAVLFSSYASMSELDGANIEVVSLENRRPDGRARGHLGPIPAERPFGYINKGTLFAVPFDLDQLEVHVNPMPVWTGLRTARPGLRSD